MRVAASLFLLGVCSAVSVLGTGCGVQQDRYDALLHANRTLEEQNVALSDEQQAAQNNASSVSQTLADARNQVRTLEDRNAQLNAELDQIALQYDQLLNRVSSLEMGPLPPDVEIALIDLSRNSPELIAFDANRGMLRFSSDFTFALGSVELQPEAANSVATLADILNSGNGAGLEVRVVGHTDNVPIGKPETRQKYPTNIHLSVGRAISVRDALIAAGVDPERILVAGYGEFRPVVPNGPRGAAANRRVEVFLAPMATTEVVNPVYGTPEPAAEAVIINEPMK